jgi:hypothetical protein
MQKQSIDISFINGVHQEIAEEVLPPGQLTKLENMYFNKTGKLSKRQGYNVLSNETTDGYTEITDSNKIIVNKNELLMTTDTTLYSYNESLQRWIDQGSYAPISVDITDVLGGTVQKRYYSNVEYVSGHYIYVYYTSTDLGVASGWYYSIQEASTGNFVKKDIELEDITNEQPVRLVKIGDNVCLVYASNSLAGYIRALVIDMGNPHLNGFIINLATDGVSDAGDRDFDVCEISDSDAFLAYTISSGTNALIFNTAGATATDYNNGTEYGSISVTKDDSDNFFIFGYSSGNVETVIILDSTLNLVATTAIETKTNLRSIRAVPDGYGNVKVFTEFQTVGGTSDKQYVRLCVVDTEGTVLTAPHDLFLSVGLASRAFIYNHRAYVFLVHEHRTNLGTIGPFLFQNTLFLGDEDGNILVRTLSEKAGKVTTSAGYQYSISNVIEKDTGIYEVVHVKKGEAIGTPILGKQPADGLCKVTLDFTKNMPNAVELGNQLLIPGGYLYSYDGHTITEGGFHLYPQRVSLSATTGGALSEGTYSYKVIYEWIDARGNIHRSGTSPAKTVSVAAPNNSVTVTVPTLRMTSKENVLIQIYRTTANGSVYNHVGSVDNDKTVHSTTYTSDGMLDWDDCYPLYSDSEATNTAYPDCKALVSWQNRLFVLAENNVIYFSQQSREQVGVSFFSKGYLLTDPDGGKITDIAPFAGRLIIAKEKKIFQVYGTGPTINGLNSQYNDPEPIPSDVGVKDGSRIIVFGNGLLLPSQQGLFYTSGGPPEYIGGPVEDYKSYDVVNSVVDGNDQLIYLLLDDYHTILVYDIRRQQWAEWKDHNAYDISIWNNNLAYLDVAENAIYYQDSSFVDYDTYITSNVATGWINLGGLIRFSILYKIYLLGKYKSPHTLNVKIYYPDGTDETITEDITSDPGEYLYIIKPAKYTTRSLKIEIWDSNHSGTGESFELLGLRPIYGIKRKTHGKRMRGV